MKLFALLLFCTLPLYSQSILLPKGESGAMGQVTYLSQSDRHGLEVLAGYSLAGQLDLELGLRNYTLPALGGYDASSVGWVANLVYMPMKDDSAQFPISAYIAGGLTEESVSSSFLDMNKTQLKNSSWNIGAGLAKTLHMGVKLIPTIGGRYSVIDQEADIIYNDTLGVTVSEHGTFDFLASVPVLVPLTDDRCYTCVHP